MKLFELTDLMLEGISPIVYHYTSAHNLYRILETNRFKLATPYGTDSERAISDKPYFLSTSRHRLGGYHLQVPTGAILVLDGSKLAHRYSGSAADYWGPNWGTPPEKKEAEDRVYSEKPYIENATQFILEVHLFHSDMKENYRHNEYRWFRKAYTEAKKKGIPIYFYDNKSDWLTQNRKNAIPLPEVIKKHKQEAEKPWYPLRYKYSRKDFKAWAELYYATDLKQLSDHARELVRRIVYYSWVAPYRILSSDIHNNRSDPESGVTKVVDIMRKEGFKSTKEFVEYLTDKWSKKLET